MDYSGTCRCEKISVELFLPKPIDTYVSRACDCDFCTERSARYLSDPEGVLEISPKQALLQRRQGSNQAIFWLCDTCQDLIAVSCDFNNETKGALNAKLLESEYQLATPTIVSPKQLSAKEKASRWDTIWMKVTFGSVG